MMDVNAFPRGTALDQLPAFNVSECETLPGGITFSCGFNVAALQALSPDLPRALVWPFSTFAFSDGENSIAAVIQNLEFGIGEVVFVACGLRITRQILRKTYESCILLDDGGIEYLWIHVPAGAVRTRKRLCRLGFTCASGENLAETAVYFARTSEMLSPACRRRLRMKLN